jgi:uncharacterized protein YoaH (UPF0181 family)
MFDTFSSFLVTNQNLNLKHLSNISEKYASGFRTLKGKLNNLRVKRVHDGISIFGSLAKFYFGNNLETLTRQTTQYAIEKISDELSIDMSNSRIYRIDTAANLLMKEPVKNYSKWFGDCRYLSKSNWRGTLYYANSRRRIVVYSKLREMKDKKQTITEGFEDYLNQVLRIELRYLNRLKEQLGKPVYVCDLYNESFYTDILDRWKSAYFSINKIKQVKPDQMNYSTVRGFKESLALSQVMEKGLDQVLSEIEANRDKFKSSVEASRCKAEIKKLASKTSCTEQSEQILELDEKVRQAVKFYR